VGVPLKDVITVVISCASLVLSAYAIWVTQFKHGRLRMTQPTLLCLKREFPGARPKIFLRTCLFTTGTKGRVIENMYLIVHQAGGTCRFDFWGHTEHGKLTLGSGLFVGSTGVASDHHFNPHEYYSNDFLFMDGEYKVDVFATVVGRKKSDRLMSLNFAMNSVQAVELVQIPTREFYLLWNPQTRSYDGHVRHDNNPLKNELVGGDKTLADILGPNFKEQPCEPPIEDNIES